MLTLSVYLIPSIVSDVAAIFVATTTFLTEELGGSNTLFCNSAKQICFIVKSTNITEKFTKGILSRWKNCTNQLSWNHIREESTWLPLHGNGHRGYSQFSQLTHTVCHMHVQFHPVLLGKPIYLLGIPQDESSSLSLQPTKYWIEFIRGTSSRQLFIRSFQVKNWNLKCYFLWRE